MCFPGLKKENGVLKQEGRRPRRECERKGLQLSQKKEKGEGVTSKHGMALHVFDECLQFFHCFEDTAVTVEIDIQTRPGRKGDK